MGIRAWIWIGIGIGVAAWTGCASVPKFAPSSPVAQAPSLQEGLLLCAEYRVPVPAERPVLLKPYLDCIHELTGKFPEKGSPAFTVFHDELDRVYSRLHEDYWTPALGRQLDAAVQTLLRMLWRGESWPAHLATAERENAARYFPRTARVLRPEQEDSARGGGVARRGSSKLPSPLLDRPYEQLRAGLEALKWESRGYGDPRSPFSQSLEDPELCQKLGKLRWRVEYLSELQRDQVELSRLAPLAKEARRARNRYRENLSRAQDELEALRGQAGALSSCAPDYAGN